MNIIQNGRVVNANYQRHVPPTFTCADHPYNRISGSVCGGFVLSHPTMYGKLFYPVRQTGCLPTDSFKFHLAMDLLALVYVIHAIGIYLELSLLANASAKCTPKKARLCKGGLSCCLCSKIDYRITSLAVRLP